MFLGISVVMQVALRPSMIQPMLASSITFLCTPNSRCTGLQSPKALCSLLLALILWATLSYNMNPPSHPCLSEVLLCSSFVLCASFILTCNSNCLPSFPLLAFLGESVISLVYRRLSKSLLNGYTSKCLLDNWLYYGSWGEGSELRVFGYLRSELFSRNRRKKHK